MRKFASAATGPKVPLSRMAAKILRAWLQLPTNCWNAPSGRVAAACWLGSWGAGVAVGDAIFAGTGVFVAAGVGLVVTVGEAAGRVAVAVRVGVGLCANVGAWMLGRIEKTTLSARARLIESCLGCKIGLRPVSCAVRLGKGKNVFPRWNERTATLLKTEVGAQPQRVESVFRRLMCLHNPRTNKACVGVQGLYIYNV